MDNEILKKCQGYLKSIDEQLNYITPSQLHEMIEDGEDLFILDNRTSEAFQSGHINGAVNIWLKDVLDDENLKMLPLGKKIIVCCWVGHTASQLMTLLRLLGFNAIGLKYGMGSPANPLEPKVGWEEAGYDIIKCN